MWKENSLDQLSETKKHQGVIAVAAAYEYAEVKDILKNAEEKGEPPFIFILDNIEDPHNLGAIIRTANLAGSAWSDHSEEPGSRTDCDRCEGICRCTELHAGCKGDKPFPDDRRAEKKKGFVLSVRIWMVRSCTGRI